MAAQRWYAGGISVFPKDQVITTWIRTKLNKALPVSFSGSGLPQKKYSSQKAEPPKQPRIRKVWHLISDPETGTVQGVLRAQHTAFLTAGGMR